MRWRLACWVFITLLSISTGVRAQRPPAVIPDDPDTILQRLPREYASFAAQRVGNKPSLAQVSSMLSFAAQTGDTRLSARAAALLGGFPADDARPEVLRARAFSAQHRHAFDESLRHLDKLIALDPRDADARFSRAQIFLVQGRITRARSECAGLAFGIDALSGALCAAALSLRTGDLKSAERFSSRWLDKSTGTAQLRRYALVMRAEIASRAGSNEADSWFRKALKIAPHDVRTLAPFAKHLRSVGRNEDALRLLENAGESDSLQLQRAFAAQAAGSPTAASLIEAQAQRYALAHLVGGETELRDEAEFLLMLRGDAVGALSLAQRNFQTQRDWEDVLILRRAARAARRPEALQPLQAWAKSERLELPPLQDASQ